MTRHVGVVALPFGAMSVVMRTTLDPAGFAPKQFESTRAVSQDDVTANYNAGMIRARQGRWTDAIESFQRAH
jgi:hypothetical protein